METDILYEYILTTDTIDHVYCSYIFLNIDKFTMKQTEVIWRKVTEIWYYTNREIMSEDRYYVSVFNNLSKKLIWCIKEQDAFFISCILFCKIFKPTSKIAKGVYETNNIYYTMRKIEDTWVNANYDKLDNRMFTDYTIPFVHLIIKDIYNRVDIQLKHNYTLARIQCLYWYLMSIYAFKRRINIGSLPKYAIQSDILKHTHNEEVDDNRASIQMGAKKNKKKKEIICKNWVHYTIINNINHDIKPVDGVGVFEYTIPGLEKDVDAIYNNLCISLYKQHDKVAKTTYMSKYRSTAFGSRKRPTDNLSYALNFYPMLKPNSCRALLLQNNDIVLSGISRKKTVEQMKREKIRRDNGTSTQSERDEYVGSENSNNPIYKEMNGSTHPRFKQYSRLMKELNEPTAFILNPDEVTKKFDAKRYNMLSLLYEVYMEVVFRSFYSFELGELLIQEDEFFEYLHAASKSDCISIGYIIAKLGNLYYLMKEFKETSPTRFSIISISSNYPKIVSYLLVSIKHDSSINKMVRDNLKSLLYPVDETTTTTK